MYRRVAQRLTLRTAIALTICIALLAAPGISFLISGAAQGQREERKGKPKPGKPEGVWPDLEKAKQQSQIEPEAPPPIPSTIRSKKNSGKPWDGRRVGDPPNGTERGSAGSDLASNNNRISEHRGNLTRRAHARARMTLPPPPPHDQFVSNFFTYALVRSPGSEETTYWYDQLRVAYASSATALKLAGIELGRTLFESSEYAARNRDAHWYVYDLYKTYLMRDPDAGGWAMWEALVPTHGREYVRRGFEESGEFATLSANITTSGVPSSNAASLISARVDARNQPGRGMLSRDANWSVPLLSLPGRAGLDLGLALSYSSMAWTRSGPYIYFDEDNGFPSPGFRLGFPTVQRKVFDAQTSKNAYLMLTAAGRRVELRHVSSNIYDAADSSYLRLTEDGALLRVHSTDGTRLTYAEANGEYRCTEIKDRNGNYLSVNYNGLGQITTITDTLTRVITFNYDSNSNPISITQQWGAQTHTWATFGWISHTMQASFGTLRVVGTANNAVLPLLKQVGLPDGDRYQFDYTNAAQVQVIRRFRSDDTQPFYNVFQYESTTTDAPRLTQTRVAAENWTSLNGVPGEVTTGFAVDPDGACRMTAPDGTIYKEYYGTGWQKGLTTLSEVWSGGVKQKWTTTAWTQDNTTVSYELNPRVTETNVYDASGNRRRTTIDYGIYAQWGLPYSVIDYAADGLTAIRNTITDYNLSQVYLDRRIIGLVAAIHQTDIVSWQRKIGFSYDDPARLHSVPAAATQHDSSYNTSFTARGNLTGVSRFDVNDIVNPAKALTAYTNYYTTGTPKSSTDPAGHQNSVTYGDSFSDNVNRNTFAYPTTITDADGFSSTGQYNFDFGGTTRTEGPPPVAQQPGAIQTITYDSIGRVERTTTVNNSAYTRYFYGANYVQSFSSVNNVADDAYNIQYFDGVGRVIATAGNHPGSTGGYRAQLTVYDLMGRAIKTSNPAEITAQWAPTGDDAGWLYTEQTYDWNHRPLVTTNPDGTTKVVSYGGCGCAGGTVTTLTDEGTMNAGTLKRRQQKLYADVLGRTWKTEVLNWDGTGPNGTGPNNTVYSTTITTFNARDQITQVRQYAGPDTSSTHQDTTMTYDGYGRLKTRHAPEQSVGMATSWDYNADDTIQKITDARGASQTFANNNRHLVTGITYAWPGGGTVPNPVSYTYDAAGNRKEMTDGTGNVTYHFDQLSRIDWEERTFTGLGGSVYRLSYAYNLADQLTSLTEPSQFGSNVSYSYDVQGRLSQVTGSGFAGGVTQFASGMKYRASGALSEMLYGNGLRLNNTFDSRLQIKNYQVKVPGTPAGEGERARTDFEYHPDGKIKSTTDHTNAGFNRGYGYDHVGRLSGATASNSSYSLTLNYDEFDNLVERRSFVWRSFHVFDSTYQNSRSLQTSIWVPPSAPEPSTWTYDADGRVTHDHNKEYTFNAAGQKTRVFETTDVAPTLVKKLWIHQDYDANGARAKRVEQEQSNSGPIQSVTSYFLRSSVLNGKVITELNEFGGRRETNVYANDASLAQQKDNQVRWQHIDPVTHSHRQTLLNGLVDSQLEFDPLGNDAPVTDPNPPEMTPDYEYVGNYGGNGNPYDGGAGCMIDGQQVPCTTFIQLVTFGTGKGIGRSNGAATSVTNVVSYIWVDEWEDVETPPGTATQGSDGGYTGSVTTQIRNVGRFVGISSGTPQNPQDTRLADAIRDLRGRLEANGGDNPCARLFGGLKNALKKLDESKIGFRSMGGPISLDGRTLAPDLRLSDAVTRGKNITINSDGRFMANNGTLPVMGRPGMFATNVNYYGLGDVASAALILAHELGHRTGKLKDERKAKDREGANDENNQRVYEACFKN